MQCNHQRPFSTIFHKILAIVCLAGVFTIADLHAQNEKLQISDNTIQLTYSGADTAAILQLIRQAKAMDGQPDSAIHLLKLAIGKSKHAGYNYGIAKALLYLGKAYIATGDYDNSIIALQSGIPYCEKTKEGKELVTAIFDLVSTAYQMKGDYVTAANYLYRAAVFAEYFPASGLRINFIYNNLGALLYRMNQLDRSLYYLNKAEENSTHNYELIASIKLNKGIIYAREHKWDTSMVYFKNGLSIARAHNLIEAQHNLLMNIGSQYLAQQMPDTALQYFLAAKAIQGNINPYYTNGMMLGLGDAYYRLHQYPVAEDYLKQALITATRLHLNNDLLDAHKLLCDLYDRTGKYEQALQQHVAYMSIKDSVEGTERIKNINQLEVKYASAEKDKELIRKQLLITQQEKYLQQKNMWLIMIAGGAIILIILLIALYRIYQHKQRLQGNRIHILQQDQEIMQLKAMMNGEEKERTRIAQELHDGIGGMLAAIKMNFSAVQKRYEELGHINELNQIMTMVEDTTGEVRKTAHNLMPNVLLRHNLATALHLYCESINMGDGPHIDLHMHGDLQPLEKAVELILYRIVQELVQNVIKHADATHVEIELNQHDHTLSISVEDDGIGFDIQEQSGGYGLQNLRYRVQALQGEISIESAKGFGTTMFINFDIDKLKNIFTS